MMSSNISGLFCSRISMRSFIAMMMLDVLSSVPCLELFSAAPVYSDNYSSYRRHWQLTVSKQAKLQMICNRRHRLLVGKDTTPVHDGPYKGNTFAITLANID